MPTPPSEDKDLLPILDRLEAGVPEHLSVSDRCKLIQRISASALTRASKQKLTIDSFTREDQALAGLLASIPYSGRWIEFCHDRASHLAETMHGEMPALALQRNWPEWNAARRMDFLQAIARHQIRLFTHDGLSFTLPKIVIDNTPPSIRGSFNAGAWALSTRVNDRIVNVSRQHFDENPPLSLWRKLSGTSIFIPCASNLPQPAIQRPCRRSIPSCRMPRSCDNGVCIMPTPGVFSRPLITQTPKKILPSQPSTPLPTAGQTAPA